MPNKKSASKELRKTIKRTAANKKISSKFKALIKTNLQQIKDKDQKVKKDFTQTIKALDKAVKKGFMKKNTISRKKSILLKKINTQK